MRRPDPHSYYDSAQPKARRMQLKLGVDFTTTVSYTHLTLPTNREV